MRGWLPLARQNPVLRVEALLVEAGPQFRDESQRQIDLAGLQPGADLPVDLLGPEPHAGGDRAYVREQLRQ